MLDPVRIDAGGFQSRCGTLGCHIDGDARTQERNTLRLSEVALSETSRANNAGFNGAVGLRIIGAIIHGMFLLSDERVGVGICDD